MRPIRLLVNLMLWLLILVVSACNGSGSAAVALPSATPYRQIVTLTPRGNTLATETAAVNVTATAIPTLTASGTLGAFFGGGSDSGEQTSEPSEGLVEGTLPGTDVLTLDAVETSFIERQISFIVRFTPYQTTIKSAVFRFTYPESGKSAEQKVGVSQQKMGKQTVLRRTLTADALPAGEDEVQYQWLLTNDQGQVFSTEPAMFKITESIAVEQRKDRPIIAATQRYESFFPSYSMFYVTLTPESPIMYARFLLTQNNGIEQYDFNVTVPHQEAGEPLELHIKWNNQFGPQIPWQQFESWWVFTDQNGKEWRTESAFNVYADNTYHPWEHVSTKYAELYTYQQSASNINVFVSAIDYSIERLSKEFGYRLLYRPHIVIYNSQADMDDWAPGSWVDYFIGMASGQWGGAVIAFYDSARFTGYSIIQHELVHVFQYQSMRSVKQLTPTWWVEGSAMYFEEQTDDILGKVKAVVRRTGAPSLMRGIGIYAPDGSNIPWVYYVGATFVTYVRQTYGNEVFSEIHAAIARDIRFSDALEMATGKSLEELNIEWQSWISQ
ncbi:MAG: hypothetical protein KF726_07325 [Anaerolineae bacterium]|nr:hypothetical protein [Anaerolineae bacterium]